MQAARRAEECRIGVVTVDHAASARRTRRRVVSGGGETGKQAAVLGRGVAHRGIAATTAWARQRDRGGASRGDAGAESWFENGWKTAAIREESESGDFFFLISMPVGPFVEAYQQASR